MTFSRHRSTLLLRLLPLVLAFVVGCGEKPNSEETANGDGPSQAQPPEENLKPLPGEPTVAVWNWEETQQAIQSHPGQVVVLHVWATWNEALDSPDVANPTQKKKKKERLEDVGFEEFVRLKQLHRDDVVALSLNTDYNLEMSDNDQEPASLKDKVREFAEKRGANFPHGISSELDEVLYYEKLEIPTTPATFVYGKQGKLRETFAYDEDDDSWYSYREDVIPLVEKLMAENYTPPTPSPTKDEKSSQKEEENAADNENKAPETEETSFESESQKAESQAKKAKVNSPEEVTMQIGDWDGLQKRVKQAKGRVVVVDLWSTQCVPCLKEFPHLVELHNQRKNDVACFSFNLDFYGVGKPEELKPDVLAMLKKLEATFPNVMSNQADEKVYEKLELASIPAVYVYDRQGELRKRFDDTQGQFTYEKDILPLVESLIEEKQ